MKKGRAGSMTLDYKRHGTTMLFAGLNVFDVCANALEHNDQASLELEY